MNRRFLVGVATLFFSVSGFALDTKTCNADGLCVQPITWNIIGLDSNNVNSGPNEFMVGARACNESTGASTKTFTNVTSIFSWLSVNANITLSDSSNITSAELKPGRCYDFYYNGLVTRTIAAYNTTRRYQINVTADYTLNGTPGTTSQATPALRELYVEKLVSQNRNSVDSITGPTEVQVGGIYTYRVEWSTATGGYDQIEHFINLQNTSFRLLESHTTYSQPAGGTNSGIYGDGCGWNDLVGDANYRSCTDGTAGDYPSGVGGSNIVTWFTVQILGATGGPAALKTLIYDYSGSSYHYNTNFGDATNTLPVTATGAADLRVTISDTPDPVTYPGTITYTGTVTNAGLSNATETDDPVLTFLLPQYTTFGSITLTGTGGTQWTCAGSGRTVTCTMIDTPSDPLVTNSLNSGASFNYTLTATLTSTAAPGTLLPAVATISSNLQDPIPSNNTATTDTTYALPTDADMSVTSTVSAPTTTPNGAVTITQTIRNNGPASAASPTFTTTIPSGVTNVSFTPPAGFSCTPATPVAGNTVTCTASSLASGSSATETITFNSGTSGSTHTSNATVSSSTGDPIPSNNTASSSVSVLAANQTDVAVTVTASPSTVLAGESILYSNCVTNNGPNTTNITFTTTLPANTTFAYLDYPAGWTCTKPNTGGTGTITCTGLNVAPSPGTCLAFPLTLNVSSTATGSIAYSASVSSSVTDPITSNNTTSASTPLVSSASASTSDISVTKSGPTTGTAGEIINYSIVATNNGPANTSGSFSIIDNLPSGAIFVSATSTRGTCSAAGTPTVVTCTVPAGLPVGGIVTVNVSVSPGSAGTTYTNTASVSYGTDPIATNNLSSAVNTTIAAATAVQRLAAEAVEKKGSVELTWRTGYEIDNVGFSIYREVGATRTRVSSSLIAGSALIAGRGVPLTAGFSYKWTDRKPVAGARYWIEDVDLKGSKTLHGPFTAMPSGTRSLAFSSLSIGDSPTFASLASNSATRATPVATALRPAPDALSDVTLARQADLAGRPAARIYAGEEGWYRITKQQLSQAGFDAGSDPRALEMYVDAVEVPIAVNDGGDGRFDANDSIDFYAFGMDTAYSGTRAYWLVTGQNGRRFSPKEKTKTTAFTGTSFPHTLERKDRFIYFAAQSNAEDKDSYYGPVVYWEPAVASFDVRNIDRRAGSVTVEAIIKGATAGPHVVRVDLNGQTLGTITFKDQESGRGTFQVPNSAVRDGLNDVTLLALGGWEDISFTDRVLLTYPHLYAADDDVLRFPVTGATEATITGFTTADVRVLDVTDPKQPMEVEVKSSPRDGGWAITVAPHAKGTRVLYAAAAAKAKVPAGASANAPSSIASRQNAADFVVISHRTFIDALAPLVAKRRAEGFETVVVDVEDVYDEFGFGSKSPDAIRAFLQHAQSQWKKAPRWVLLVGDATTDPRNYVGLAGNDLVPTRILPTKYMKTASDDWMVDFDGDLVPNMYLGRLSVSTVEEAQAVVAKIAAYQPQPKTVLLAADRNDTAQFEEYAAATRTAIPASYSVKQMLMGSEGDPRGAFLSALAQRPSVVNYVGHGSIEGLSNLDFFRSGDAAALAGSQSTPFWVLMNCLNAMFHDTWSYSLGEALLRTPQGGAIAVWASSGLADPAAQNTMNRAFWNIVGTRRGATIGEMVAAAKASTGDAEVRKTWTLLGDPTLRLGN